MVCIENSGRNKGKAGSQMALKKQVLIVSQVIPQWYVDVLAEALEEGVHIDIITGSNVRG